MNSTDLRIAYRMDTGDYPLWAHDHSGRDLGYSQKSFQKGHPCTNYGLWLEDKIGKPKYLRDRYFKVTSDPPNKFYYGDWKSSNGFSGKRENVDVLYADYIEWLESFLIKFKDEYPI